MRTTLHPTVRATALAVVVATLSALCAIVALVLPSTAANAATYPPTTCATISVSTTAPRVGQSITVTGKQFVANEQVSLYLTPAADFQQAAPPAGSSILLARVTTDANGAFSAEVTMPSGATGNQVISADGDGKICPADPIQILVSGGGPNGGSSSPPGGSGEPPAVTGTDVALLGAIALALLATGLLVARGGKRKHASSRH